MQTIDFSNDVKYEELLSLHFAKRLWNNPIHFCDWQIQRFNEVQEFLLQFK